MNKKVTMIALPVPGTGRIRGIGSGGSNREFRIGYACDGAFGGGPITSMVEDLERQCIVIRKDRPFAGPIEGGGAREVFEEVCVPFARTSYWAAVTDRQEDPPAARPAQNQTRR